jgi:hypothetical protein
MTPMKQKFMWKVSFLLSIDHFKASRRSISNRYWFDKGKRKMVEGFIRWCRKGDVGLSQQATVKEVKDEDPTGLYDGFYVRTK